MGKVSSLTLTNLPLIDNAPDMLIPRSIICYEKEHVIMLPRQINTEGYAKTMPEYYNVISKCPPTSHADVKSYIKQKEAQFDCSILEIAGSQAKVINIQELVTKETKAPIAEIETTVELGISDGVLDIRFQNEQEECRLTLDNIVIIVMQMLPFYKLGKHFCKLDQSKLYFLYSKHGVMSCLPAYYLHKQGF